MPNRQVETSPMQDAGLLTVEPSWDEQFVSVRESLARRDPKFKDKLARTLALVENHARLPQHKWEYLMQEAISSSDFPLLFGNVLERQLLAAYAEAPQTLQQAARSSTSRDFRLVERYEITTARGRLQEITPDGEYKERKVGEARYTYRLISFGEKIPIRWQAIINDDLGALTRLPSDLAIAARRTEDWYLAQMLFDANGPHASYFGTNAGAQAAMATTTLTIEHLAAAINEMALYHDEHGEPIYNVPRFLVVGPALRLEAYKILEPENFAVVASGLTTAGTRVVEQVSTLNAVKRYNLTVVVSDWIPLVATAGTLAATSWILLAAPDALPALEFGHLRGHETPELWIKAADAQRIGGGMEDPMAGSFDNDAVTYKVRHTIGGTRLNVRAGWGSRGQ